MNAFPIDVWKLLQICKPLLWMGGHIDKVRGALLILGEFGRVFTKFIGTYDSYIYIYIYTHTHTLTRTLTYTHIYTYISHVGVFGVCIGVHDS